MTTPPECDDEERGVNENPWLGLRDTLSTTEKAQRICLLLLFIFM